MLRGSWVSLVLAVVVAGPAWKDQLNGVGLEVVDEMWASTCLPNAAAPNKTVTTRGGLVSPVLLSGGTWVTSMINIQIAGIILRERLGYDVSSFMTGSSDKVFRTMHGCANPLGLEKYGSTGCVLPEGQSWAHAGFEMWPGYISFGDYKGYKNYGDMPNSHYFGYEGLFVFKDIVDAAYKAEGKSLLYYTAYDVNWNPPLKYFNTPAEVAQIAKENKVKQGCPGFTQAREKATKQKWAKMYLDLTGDEEGAALSADDTSLCDEHFMWRSKACRVTGKCIPILTVTYSFMATIMQASYAYNWSVALYDSDWGDYGKLGNTMDSIVYWYLPDATFAKRRPEPLQLPPHNPNEYLDGRLTTMNKPSPLSNAFDPSLAPPSPHPQLYGFLHNFAPNDPDMKNLMENLVADGMEYNDKKDQWAVACQWVKDNQKRWEQWIPAEPCVPGQTRPSEDADCMTCPAGNYCPAGVSDPIPCSAGNYCPAGSSSQTPCMAGTINSKTGSVNATDCMPCEPGQYMSKDGRSVCQKCTAGFFMAEYGATACEGCDFGTYQSNEGQSKCDACMESFTTVRTGVKDRSECTCADSQYWNREMDKCEACQEQAVCKGGLGLPVISEGFYARYSGNADPAILSQQVAMKKANKYVAESGAFSGLQVWECSSLVRCPNNSNFIVPTILGDKHVSELGLTFGVRMPEACPDGTQNIACAQCSADRFGKHCTELCTGGAGTGAIVTILVLLPLVMAAGYYATDAPYLATTTGAFVLASTIGIAVFLLQSMAVVHNFNIPWPDLLDSLLVFDLFLFDLGGTATGCVFGQNFLAQYWLPIGIPPLAILAMAVAYGVSQLVQPIKGKVMVMGIDGCMNLIGLLASALYITLCKVVISYFECEPNPGTTDYTLAKFKSVECQSEERSQATVPMVLGMLVYVLFFFSLTTWMNVTAPRKFMESPSFRKRSKFLVNRWRPDVWWWGQVFILRNLFISIVAVISSNPTDQCTLMGATMCIFLTFSALMQPWKDVTLGYLDYSVSLFVIMCTYVGNACFQFNEAYVMARHEGNKRGEDAAMEKLNQYSYAMIGMFAVLGVWIVGTLLYCLNNSRPSTVAKRTKLHAEYIVEMVQKVKVAVKSPMYFSALESTLETATYYDRVAIEAWLRNLDHYMGAELANATVDSSMKGSRKTAKLTGRLHASRSSTVEMKPDDAVHAEV